MSSGCTGRMDSCRGYVELVALCGDYLNEPPLISKLSPSLSSRPLSLSPPSSPPSFGSVKRETPLSASFLDRSIYLSIHGSTTIRISFETKALHDNLSKGYRWNDFPRDRFDSHIIHCSDIVKVRFQIFLKKREFSRRIACCEVRSSRL